MLFSGHRETWVPVALYAQVVAEGQIAPVFVTSISEHGLVLDSPALPEQRPGALLHLELTLPGDPYPLWIGVEVVRDVHGLLFEEIGIRFLVMANAHWRALRRWVRVRELVLATRPIWIHDAA